MTLTSKNTALHALADKHIFVPATPVMFIDWRRFFVTYYFRRSFRLSNFVLENLCKYYPDSIPRSTWEIIGRFWKLDLSFTDEFLKDKYSKFGPKPRIPSCMQHSYLLSIAFKVTSITAWATQLKLNPLYSILSGFQVDDTPGVGTFYDFFKRLWDLAE